MANGLLDLLKPYKNCLIVCLLEFIIAGFLFQFFQINIINILQFLFLFFGVTLIFFSFYLIVYIYKKYPENYHGWTGYKIIETIYDKTLFTHDIIIRRKIYNFFICCMILNFFNLITIVIFWDLLPRFYS